MAELDYEAERCQITEVHAAVMPRFGRVVAVPEVVPSHCSASVLTMSLLPGLTLEDEIRRQNVAAGLPAGVGSVKALLAQNAAASEQSGDGGGGGLLWGLVRRGLSVVGVDAGFAAARAAQRWAAAGRWAAARLVQLVLPAGGAAMGPDGSRREPGSWAGWAEAELRRQAAAEVTTRAEGWLATLFEVPAANAGAGICCTLLSLWQVISTGQSREAISSSWKCPTGASTG